MGWTDSLRGFFGLPGARGVAGALGELVLWWAGGSVFWLATASTVTLGETLVAAAVALVAAVLARVARRAIPFEAKPALAWLRWTSLVPVSAVADSARLVPWLAGRQPEDVVEAQLPRSTGRAETGLRSGAILALSATPGTVVIDCDPDTGTARMHSLVKGWPHLDERVAAGAARTLRRSERE
ncbi:Na+/H+ antiporter subunit E [Sinomonas susongensis]|uniref:Na+/H+ antiporter subunit E n=1 Tax=Sinomonas susongensis TaxID=1324851 RepID=UPI0011085FAA|nr:Na+/H+ antiporter subunit E [Sinomonas susongensis]